MLLPYCHSTTCVLRNSMPSFTSAAFPCIFRPGIVVERSCVPSAGALVGSRQDECCWSLNGRNRSAAHEWPAGGGGRHLLVLLRPAQCTRSHPIKHSNSSSGSSSNNCYPSSRFWLSVGELSGLVVVMSAPSGSGQVQPWVVAAW